MASKRRLRRRACEGKQSFTSKADALSALIGVRRRTGGAYLDPYCCKHCSKWHYGRPSASKLRGIRAKAANEREAK